MRFEFTEHVNVSQEKLFDFLSTGKLNDIRPDAVSNRIVKREGNLIFREVVLRNPKTGKETKFQAKDELIPPSKMITTGEAKKYRVIGEYTLESQTDGSTRVVVGIDVKPKGVVTKIVMPFFKGRLKTGLQKEAKVIREYLEKQYGENP